MAPHSVLFISTSYKDITDEIKTGVWLEELTVPYNVFKEAGFKVTISTVDGNEIPVDPHSLPKEGVPSEFAELLKHTVKVSTLNLDEYDAVFIPGGHGAVYDLATNKDSIAAIEHFAAKDKIVSSVCHGPASLLHVKVNGKSIVAGKKVSCFTDVEENMAKPVPLDKLPFFLETELKKLGAEIHHTEPWGAFSIADGKLVTGQNPASSEGVAKKVIELLNH